MSDQESQSIEESIIDILGYFKQVLRYLTHKWYIPLVFLVIGGLNAYFKQKKEIGSYNYNIKFVKATDLNPNIGGTPGFPEIFSSQRNKSNIVVSDVVYSDIILSETLLNPYKDEKDEYLIDLFARTYFPEKYNTLRFTNNKHESFNEAQISLFKSIKGRLQSRTLGMLTVIDANVPSIIVSTKNEDLSIGLGENLFLALNDFYSGTSALVSKRNIKRLSNQADSLRNVLQVTEAQLASRKDIGGLDIKPTNFLSRSRLEQKATLTQEQYVGIEKLLVQEQLKADVNEPVYKILNKPIPPLGIKLPNVKRAVVIGALIGFFIGIFLTIAIFALAKFWSLYKKA